jgi:hypothetical protein
MSIKNYLGDRKDNFFRLYYVHCKNNRSGLEKHKSKQIYAFFATEPEKLINEDENIIKWFVLTGYSLFNLLKFAAELY